MLSYHPSNDLYHCIYRIFLLTRAAKVEAMEWERLRLMDFYFCFPHLLKDFGLPRQYQGYKRVFKSVAEPYEEIGSPRRLFFQIGSLQESAIRSLIAKGYFDRDAFTLNAVAKPKAVAPAEIVTMIESEPKIAAEWFAPFIEVFLAVSLTGKNGLKGRSEMLEHRYDPH